MYPIATPAQLATYLRALRQARGLTQARFAEMLGVTRARVTQIEKDPSNIGFTQLQRMLQLLGARLVIDAGERGTEPRRAPTPPTGEW